MVILVVDSSVLIIERLQLLLTENGYADAVYGAVSYKDAMRYFQDVKPDIVLLDSGLPWNTCIDLLKEIKESEARTSVIVLKNQGNDQARRQYESFGADYSLDKYYDFEKIPGIIRTIMDLNKKTINEILN